MSNRLKDNPITKSIHYLRFYDRSLRNEQFIIFNRYEDRRGYIYPSCDGTPSESIKDWTYEKITKEHFITYNSKTKNFLGHILFDFTHKYDKDHVRVFFTAKSEITDEEINDILNLTEEEVENKHYERQSYSL